MKPGLRTMLSLSVLAVLLSAVLLPAAGKSAAPGTEKPDLAPRLQEIYAHRALWLLTDGAPPPLEPEYHPDLKSATWALHHERGKIRYMRQWAQNRAVTIVEARPEIRVRQLSASAERARYYVAQSISLGYVYAGEPTVNRFGIGTRHIVELRRVDDRWLIGMEWYTDPLGDDTEVPDVAPALVDTPLTVAAGANGVVGTAGALSATDPAKAMTVRPEPGSEPAMTPRGYNRQGAADYADKYCGLAWGCGNDRRYNPKYRDYNGAGGDCTNFVSQAIREGGKLRLSNHTRVSNLSSALQYSGSGRVAAKAPFGDLWKRAAAKPNGFRDQLAIGDLVAYQEKGKLEHFAVVTGFDTRGYPLVDSHTADRYHVPFDLGWDRKTVYWLFRMQ